MATRRLYCVLRFSFFASSFFPCDRVDDLPVDLPPSREPTLSFDIRAAIPAADGLSSLLCTMTCTFSCCCLAARSSTECFLAAICRWASPPCCPPIFSLSGAGTAPFSGWFANARLIHCPLQRCRVGFCSTFDTLGSLWTPWEMLLAEAAPAVEASTFRIASVYCQINFVGELTWYSLVAPAASSPTE